MFHKFAILITILILYAIGLTFWTTVLFQKHYTSKLLRHLQKTEVQFTFEQQVCFGHFQFAYK